MDPKSEDENEEEGWDDEDEPQLIPKISEDSLLKVKDYVLWSSDQIVERQKKVIDEACELLGISEDEAISALKHFNWNPEKLQENWFTNEEKTRET